jgi:hypothetical protein
MEENEPHASGGRESRSICIADPTNPFDAVESPTRRRAPGARLPAPRHHR